MENSIDDLDLTHFSCTDFADKHHEICKKLSKEISLRKSPGDKILLGKKGEFHCFRKMNYCYYVADKLRNMFNSETDDAKKLKLRNRVLLWHSRAETMRNKIVVVNMPLAKRYVRKHVISFLLREEADAACYLGLINAVRGFNYSRGVRFSTYAYKVFMGSAQRLFRQIDKHKHVGSITKYAAKSSGLVPDPIDFVSIIETEEAVDRVAKVMFPKLLEREADVLCRHIGLHRTQQTFKEIAKEYNLSRQRIEQIYAVTLRHIRYNCPFVHELL